MNNPNTKLEDLIHVEQGIIPSYICDDLVKDIETREWRPHTWYNPVEDASYSEETMELDIQPATPELQRVLGKYVVEAGGKYNQKYSYPFSDQPDRSGHIISQFCHIRFNRYAPGQIMRQHYDHIHDIFDGVKKGIPVLSFILNFNDDYEGADLFFWDDTVIKLGKGDIVMFPSCFLLPHGVTEATKGKRYSGVCWGW